MTDLPAGVPPVQFDARSFILHGKRTLLIMGEIHYARSPRQLWPALLDRSAECGVNSVATYIFWNWHEGVRDCYDFSGDRDLGYFLSLCAERGLHVLVRMGPYCCGEWNYGGFPSWLREEPGITIRTWSEPYLERVAQYFRRLCAEIRPFLTTNGGPIILAQVENEYANVALRYGEGGQRYLRWMAELALSEGIDVPLIMCEGATPGAIETVNGHSISAERATAFRHTHPQLPMMWTELWPAWYDTWGFQPHRRDARNIAWHILRFLCDGGAGWNYYMWHGGTNFGRNSMYLQTTSYGFDAPLDEYGAISAKGAYLSRLHHVLAEHAHVLLNGDCQITNPSYEHTHARWTSGPDSLSIDLLPNMQGRVLVNDRVLFDCDDEYRSVLVTHQCVPKWQVIQPIIQWSHALEPLPAQRTQDAIIAEKPCEQLSLTQDATDYCWYSTGCDIALSGEHRLIIERGGDMLYIYLDGALLTQSQPPFVENRGRPAPDIDPFIPANELESESGDGYRQEFIVQMPSGRHRLDILATALGLVKGDWQLAGSMQTERKGIWGNVLLDGKVLTGWEMRAGMLGERAPLDFTLGLPTSARPCSWYRGEFELPAAMLQSGIHVRLDARSLGKGHLWMNGYPLGRHWLIAGDGYGPDQPWHFRDDNGMYLGEDTVETQRYYHIPLCWLSTSNTLLIFEEQACLPADIRIEIRQAQP